VGPDNRTALFAGGVSEQLSNGIWDLNDYGVTKSRASDGMTLDFIFFLPTFLAFDGTDIWLTR
jgi:hypothetical protein